jgi:ABC-type transport system involved in cytochrome bd biosynthesis fused ATPase/permease subunit
MPRKVVCVALFVAACCLLYFGWGMLLVVPGYPGERYLASARILYGVISVLASAALLTTTGWLWRRSGASVSVIILFWIGLLIVAGIRQG